MNVPFAIIGGILALHLTGTVFSISAGIGFIALFGICIQNGVILISVFKQNLHNKIHAWPSGDAGRTVKGTTGSDDGINGCYRIDARGRF